MEKMDNTIQVTIQSRYGIQAGNYPDSSTSNVVWNENAVSMVAELDSTLEGSTRTTCGK